MRIWSVHNLPRLVLFVGALLFAISAVDYFGLGDVISSDIFFVPGFLLIALAGFLYVYDNHTRGLLSPASLS